ncbi:MAG: hypothetical protein IPN30_09825 [Flavobacteriales bacterium]|nr:hypothetical protein [Flavobacteriales bacterium]
MASTPTWWCTPTPAALATGRAAPAEASGSPRTSRTHPSVPWHPAAVWWCTQRPRPMASGAVPPGSSIWSTVNTNGTPLGAFAAGNRIVVYTSSEAYGYGDSSTGGSIWGNTGLDGTPIDSRGTR